MAKIVELTHPASPYLNDLIKGVEGLLKFYEQPIRSSGSSRITWMPTYDDIVRSCRDKVTYQVEPIRMGIDTNYTHAQESYTLLEQIETLFRELPESFRRSGHGMIWTTMPSEEVMETLRKGWEEYGLKLKELHKYVINLENLLLR